VAAVQLTIFTVVNAAYMHLGEAWARKVCKVAGLDPTFVCTDTISYAYLSGLGFSCTLGVSDRPRSQTGKTDYPASTFPSDEASFTVSQKLTTALSYLQQGQSVIFSDVDAIWIRNPVPDLLKIDCDLSFQPASFPAEAKAAWGFAVCTGFFHLRPTPPVILLVQASIRRFDGSDQRSVNLSLLENFDIAWESRPKGWEHGRVEGGWVTPISGECRRTGMRLAALPHAYYQRHGTQAATWRHSFVLHPNSPKDAESKFRVLRDLGVDI
jgi:hypothetical protein